jgi:hypothetical protein
VFILPICTGTPDSRIQNGYSKRTDSPPTNIRIPAQIYLRIPRTQTIFPLQIHHCLEANNENMKVAITGVCGVIGSTIHDHLKHSGLEIVGIDQPEPATQAPEEHRPHIEYVDITCDLSDPLDKLLARNPFDECDAVIHLAAGLVFVGFVVVVAAAAVAVVGFVGVVGVGDCDFVFMGASSFHSITSMACRCQSWGKVHGRRPAS